MRIVVHCGQPKTGTTALQVSMYLARDALARHGVCYPLGGGPSAQTHKAIGPLFLEPGHLTTHLTHDGLRRRRPQELAAQADRTWESIRREVVRTRPDVLVLSAETFCAIRTTDEAERMRDLLHELSDDVELCLYVRNPADRYQSGVRQAVRARGVFNPPTPLNVRTFLDSVEAAFGRPATLRAYDRSVLVGGDIVADFLSAVDERIPPEVVPTMIGNESLSTEATILLLGYRRRIVPDTIGYNAGRPAIARQLLRELDGKVPRSVSESLRPGVRAAILRASTELDWLRERYGFEVPGVRYPVDDGSPSPDLTVYERIEDVCVVDDDRLAELTARLLDALVTATESGVRRRLRTVRHGLGALLPRRQRAMLTKQFRRVAG